MHKQIRTPDFNQSIKKHPSSNQRTTHTYTREIASNDSISLTSSPRAVSSRISDGGKHGTLAHELPDVADEMPGSHWLPGTPHSACDWPVGTERFWPSPRLDFVWRMDSWLKRVWRWEDEFGNVVDCGCCVDYEIVNWKREMLFRVGGRGYIDGRRCVVLGWDGWFVVTQGLLGLISGDKQEDRV